MTDGEIKARYEKLVAEGADEHAFHMLHIEWEENEEKRRRGHMPDDTNAQAVASIVKEHCRLHGYPVPKKRAR